MSPFQFLFYFLNVCIMWIPPTPIGIAPTAARTLKDLQLILSRFVWFTLLFLNINDFIVDPWTKEATMEAKPRHMRRSQLTISNLYDNGNVFVVSFS